MKKYLFLGLADLKSISSSSSMKIALIYLNDLFFNSGTAVIIRRIFENLTSDHEVIHLIGSETNLYRSSSEIEISKLYQSLPFKITPFFLQKQKFVYYYEFLLKRIFQISDARLSGLNYAFQISKILRSEKPDCIWCVLCHMPQTLATIYYLKEFFRFNLPLHISIYDPLELWTQMIGSKYFYQKIIKSAVSIDTIGINLQQRIFQAFNKQSLIMNDYIDELNLNESFCGEVRVAIAGHIYDKSDIQLFLDLASSVFTHVSILWYGNEKNYALLSQLCIPENIEIQKKGIVDRTLLPTLICDCSFAYLSMPQDTEHFSRYSVPTKLVTYFEAGLPVVFHAPLYSEICNMNSHFGFGLNLSNLRNPNQRLTSICSDRSFYQEGINKIYLERYQKNNLTFKFCQIIDELSKCVEAGSNNYK